MEIIRSVTGEKQKQLKSLYNKTTWIVWIFTFEKKNNWNLYFVFVSLKVMHFSFLSWNPIHFLKWIGYQDKNQNALDFTIKTKKALHLVIRILSKGKSRHTSVGEFFVFIAKSNALYFLSRNLMRFWKCIRFPMKTKNALHLAMVVVGRVVVRRSTN